MNRTENIFQRLRAEWIKTERHSLDLGFILYSHSSYDDCWPMFFGSMKEHLDPYFKFDEYFIFTDKVTQSVGHFKEINYDEELSYTKRMHQCLSQIESDYILICHEDMMLYKDISKKYFLDAVNVITKDPSIDSIKLIKCDDIGNGNPYSDKSDVLEETNSKASMQFAIQPTLWKKKSYLNILKQHDNNIWEFEVEGQKTCKELKQKSLYTYHKTFDRKRGKYHYESCTYPYIATAIVKGKWNTKEYPELISMAIKYNINIDERGRHKS